MRSDEDAYALRCFEQALQVARQGNNKFDEADALHMLGKVSFPLKKSLAMHNHEEDAKENNVYLIRTCEFWSGFFLFLYKPFHSQ